MILNSHSLSSGFSDIDDPAYMNIATEMNEIFEKHSRSYIIYLFRKSLNPFADYWFKLKEYGANIEAIKLSDNYRKENFFKMIRAAFSKFSGSVETMLKVIKKHFGKDNNLISLEYDKLQDFILKEYIEMEKFSRAAYEEPLAPSIVEIKSVLIANKP